MAMKDWKQIEGVGEEGFYRMGKKNQKFDEWEQFEIIKDGDDYIVTHWIGASATFKVREFETKAKAMRYVKAYMKTH